MNIKGKVAIVTGASGGIGEAAARLLAKKGVKVALVARSKDKLAKISKELPDSKVFVCDMSKFDQVCVMVKKVVNEFGGVDILVNNAGRGYDARVENIDIKKFQDLFNLDVAAYVVAMQEVIPLFRKRGGGAIVNISSGTALMALPNMAAYSSLKRAVAGISLTAAAELLKDNISVSVVYPYITDTDFEKNTLRDGEMEWNGLEDSDESELASADPPEFVAEKIIDAVEKGTGQIYAHAWMKPKST